jgi:hypothetical protein
VREQQDFTTKYFAAQEYRIPESEKIHLQSRHYFNVVKVCSTFVYTASKKIFFVSLVQSIGAKKIAMMNNPASMWTIDQQRAMMIPVASTPFPKFSGSKSSAFEIFVGDLSFFCQEQDLYNLFAQFGNVQNVRIIRNGHRKRSLTFGFVAMSSPKEARDMMNLFNGHMFMGRNLK